MKKSKTLTFYSGLATLLLFVYGILLPFGSLGTFTYPILKLMSISIISIAILQVFITLNFWRSDKHARQIAIAFLVIILISFLSMFWFFIFFLIPFLIELILLNELPCGRDRRVSKIKIITI